jgi:hypothetical protein
MSADTHSNDQELARARSLRTIAIASAVIAFLALVLSFGLGWKPWFQVPVGMLAYICIEWQRHIGKKIKQLSGS